MIKALSIQVQPHLSRDLRIERVQAICESIARLPLVLRHQFDEGHDGVHYFNFTFGTEDLPALWREIQARLYADPGQGEAMAAASVAMCEGASGWDDYRLLHHCDPSVPRQPL